MAPEFTLFRQLATELRIQIWDLVAYQERDVKVALTIEKGNPVSKPNASDKILGLLHANTESRQVGLGIYIKMLTKSSLSCIYFNPDVDILCVRFADCHIHGLSTYDSFKEYAKDMEKHRRWHVMFAYGTINDFGMEEHCGFICVKSSMVVVNHTMEESIDAIKVVLKRTGWLVDSEDCHVTGFRWYKWTQTK